MLIRSHRVIIGIFVKIQTVTSRVIKDAVQDDIHPPFLRFLAKLPERILIAQHGRDLMKITRIVSVIGGRFKDGIDIQNGNAHFMQVIQFVDDTRKRTAVKIPLLNPAESVLHVFHRRLPIPDHHPTGPVSMRL